MRPRPRSLQSISPPKPTWPGRSTWTPEAIGLNRSKVFEPAAVDLLVRATAGVPRSVFENIVVVIVCRSKRPDNVSPVQVQFSRIGASDAELKALRFGRHLDVADAALCSAKSCSTRAQGRLACAGLVEKCLALGRPGSMVLLPVADSEGMLVL